MKINQLFKYISVLAFTLMSLQIFAQTADEEFNKAIESADNYFNSGDYINAKATYQYALNKKPDAYAKQKLEESIGLIKVQMEINQKYAQKIMTADDLFEQKDYDSAIKVYEEGLELVPDDSYALGKIAEINQIQTDIRIREEGYNSSVAEGNKYFQDKDYNKSLDAFQKANQFKPEEEYPVERIETLKEILADIAANLNEYDAALQKAEQFAERNAYDNAITQMERAIELKPEENFPKQRLDEIRKLKEDYDTYAKLVSEGDELYIAKDFEKAKEKYSAALALNPDDAYVKNLIDRIDIAMADLESLNASSYEIAIAKADKYFSEEDYDSAMKEYKKALLFKPDEEYAKQKISEINQVVTLRNSLEEAYKQTISKADKLFQEEALAEAKDEYEKARDLKPLEQYPEVKISEIDDILEDLKNKWETYTSLIAGADKLFFADDYEEARNQYQKASDMFPLEEYPIDQITMINDIIGLRDSFLRTLTHADQLMNDKDFDAALLEYRKAAELDKEADYPREKIHELEIIISEQKQLAEIEARYNDYIVNADQQLENKDYIIALAEYRKALEIKSEDDYALSKIDEINLILTDLAAAEALQSRYDEQILKADNFYNANDLASALSAYEKALEFKSGEKYAQDKIDNIKATIAAMQAEEDLQRQYNQIIELADAYYNNEAYEDALTEYRNAHQLLAEVDYPQDRIEEISKMLSDIADANAIQAKYDEAIMVGDQLFNDKNYKDALSVYEQAQNLKPKESYPKEGIAAIQKILDDIAAAEELQRQYDTIIAEADAQFAAGDYENAKNSFQSAANLKPEEKYPQDQISEINTMIQWMADEAELQKQYDAALAEADQYFEVKNYEFAILSYQKAGGLRPEEQYPKDQIQEISNIQDKLVAAAETDRQYLDAINQADELFAVQDYTGSLSSFKLANELKPEEPYPPSKIAEIEQILESLARQDALNNEYFALIDDADAAFSSADYENSKNIYTQALELKPAEGYPKQKIAEIDTILEDIARQKQIDEEYNSLITAADSYFGTEAWNDALSSYQKALDLKPDETYPPEKIIEINGILQAMADQERLRQNYDDAVSRGDQLLAAGEHSNARASFMEAGLLIPDEQYPKDKIAEIDTYLDEQAEILRQYQESVAFADKHFENQDWENARYEYKTANGIKPDESYPTEKLKEIDEIEAELTRLAQIEHDYNEAITAGDQFLKDEDFAASLSSYEKALTIKPGDNYAGIQVVKLKDLLAQHYKDMRKVYDLTITKADNYFNEGDYQMAKLQYEAASGLFPDEIYPIDKLKEVNEMILLERQKVQEEYDKAIADADKFYATKVYDQAINSYRLAAQISPTEEYPVIMISF